MASSKKIAELETLEYLPSSRTSQGFVATTVLFFANIVRNRELIWQLFKRDFLSAYRKTYLSYFWIFLAPVAGVVSWVLMNYTGVLRPGEVGVPYPVYVLVGSSLFGFWIGTYQAASATLTSGAGLLTQVKYPHEVLLAKQLAQHFANFTLSFSLIIIVLIASGAQLHWQILLFPFVILPAVFLAISFGLFAAMIAIVAGDITNAINAGLGLLIYFSPVVYSRASQGDNLLGRVNDLNPLTHLICSARDILLYGRLYDNSGYLYSALATIPILLIAWRCFYVGEQRLVEKIL